MSVISTSKQGEVLVIVADNPPVNALGVAVRGGLADAIADGTARVVEREGQVTGYATALAFFGHAVGESNDDIRALIGAADSFPGAGCLVPARNSALLRFCLDEGLKITQTMTLMTQGVYTEPVGAWLPSVLY